MVSLSSRTWDLQLKCPYSNSIIIRDSSPDRFGYESRYRAEFEEVKIIGAGAFGVVSYCRSKLDEQLYAVKKIDIFEARAPFDIIKREVVTLSKMDHPNIVRYYQAWIERRFEGETPHELSVHQLQANRSRSLIAPCLYIQTEYCPRTLMTLLKKPIAMELADKLWSQLLEAVVHMHNQGVVHCGLNLTNVLLDKDDNIKVADFGLARAVGDVGTFGWGVPYYTAPEVRSRHQKIGFEADVFSLALFYVQLYHQSFTDGEKLELWRKASQGNLIDGPKFTPETSKLLMMMMNENPEMRPTLDEVMQKTQPV